METVNVLWTGGWDSTFRVMQLSTQNVFIQPFYLKDNRKSEVQELNAIETITEDIKKLDTTNCVFRELIKINVSEVPENIEITQAFKNLSKNRSIGGQYDWLARFAKSVGNVELNIEEGTKPFKVIKKYGDLRKVESDYKGDFYILDRAVSNTDLIKVFGNYHFPLLHYSKLEMKKDAEEKGYLEIMNKTWFCHKPIKNDPCGTCNPCIGTIEGGLSYRFTSAGLRRYQIHSYLNPVKKSSTYRTLRKIYRLMRPKKHSTSLDKTHK